MFLNARKLISVHFEKLFHRILKLNVKNIFDLSGTFNSIDFYPILLTNDRWFRQSLGSREGFQMRTYCMLHRQSQNSIHRLYSTCSLELYSTKMIINGMRKIIRKISIDSFSSIYLAFFSITAENKHLVINCSCTWTMYFGGRFIYKVYIVVIFSLTVLGILMRKKYNFTNHWIQ